MIDAPPVDVETHATPIAGSTGLALEDTRPLPRRARVDVSWAHAPLVFVDEDGGSTPVVADAWATSLSTAISAGPVTVGGGAPILVAREADLSGDLVVVGPIVGDPWLGARVVVVEAGTAPGFGVVVRGTAPTQASSSFLGSPNPTVAATLVSDVDIAGTRWALNLGSSLSPGGTLDGGPWGAQGHARVGADVPLEAGGISAELSGTVNAVAVGAAGRALEAIVGGWWDPVAEARLRAAVGLPLSTGVGVPLPRIVLVWEHRPRADQG